MHCCNRVGLLEEWVSSPEGSGEDSSDALRNPSQGVTKGGPRGSPHQEQRIDIFKGSVESRGDREVATDDLDHLDGGGADWRNPGCADQEILRDQLRDDLAPD